MKKTPKKSKKIDVFGKIKPLGDRVVVKPYTAEEKDHKKTASGIFIPDESSHEKPEQGTVMAIGPGRYDEGERDPMEVKVGDTVVFSKYGYDEVKVDEEKYFIIKQENILAIIK